ncbi:carbohydrate ABC transporter permease [Cohnella zeiphila]|nr:carbohydrate ABC transporter permease [Cohnella zeiphila]
MSLTARRFGMSLVYLLLILMVLITVLPLYWMISTSLKTPTDVFSYPPKMIPSTLEWGNFANAWDMAPWGRYFVNTALYTACTVLGVLLSSVTSGYAFAKLSFKGRNSLFLAYVGTMMIPSQVTIIPVYMILAKMNWVDTYAGLIVPGLTSAFGCFLMRQFIAGIPTEIIESGLIDGAGHLKILRSIVSPLLYPAVATLGIFTFMGAWNNFFWPLVVTNSDELRTVQIGLSSFQNQYGTADWGSMMAAATLVSLPVLVLFFFAQRYFIEGIAMTGVKG